MAMFVSAEEASRASDEAAATTSTGERRFVRENYRMEIETVSYDRLNVRGSAEGGRFLVTQHLLEPVAAVVDDTDLD